MFPTIWSTFVKDDPGYGHKMELSLGFLDLPYAVPNICLENGKAKAHVRIGWLRSVNNIPIPRAAVAAGPRGPAAIAGSARALLIHRAGGRRARA